MNTEWGGEAENIQTEKSKLHCLHFKETLRRERIQHNKIKLTFWYNATNGIAVVNENGS